MKKLLISLVLLCSPLLAIANIGVSVTVGQPDFYGQINIGNAPPPVLVYNNPVIITPGVAGPRTPMYLRVPEGHYRHWDRFCGRYNACGRQVYFVQDGWYRNSYAPWYKEHGGPKENRGWRAHDRDGDQGNRSKGRGHGDNGRHRGHGNRD